MSAVDNFHYVERTDAAKAAGSLAPDSDSFERSLMEEMGWKDGVGMAKTETLSKFRLAVDVRAYQVSSFFPIFLSNRAVVALGTMKEETPLCFQLLSGVRDPRFRTIQYPRFTLFAT